MVELFERIAQRIGDGGELVALTGAGISAESGIPTFRGDDGFWTRGSTNYRPEELATWRTFASDPELVWPWYLWRLARCRDAQPNPGHTALVDMDEALGNRFTLVTQNVDGLHSRAGSPEHRSYHIHGNLERMRCSAECNANTWPVPDALRVFAKGDAITPADEPLLRCPSCDAWARPHVLWFDECYDEKWFRYRSSMSAAMAADVLLVVGTSGSTNLPMQMASQALRSKALIVEINLRESAFSDYAVQSGGGLVTGPAGTLLPKLARRLASGSSA